MPLLIFFLQICELYDKNVENVEKVIDRAGLPKLLPSELTYLREYVWVTHPVAYALDLLQKEKYMFLGYLLPTVHSLLRQLEARRKMKGKPLKYCVPLLNEMIRSINSERRFGCMMTEEDLLVATSLIPCFKIDWDGLNVHSSKGIIQDLLLKQMKAVDDGTHPCVRHATENVHCNNSFQTFEAERSGGFEEPDEDSLFFGLNHSTLSRHSAIPDEESVEEELARFLSSSSQTSIEDCFGEKSKKPFKRLGKLFLYYNTALPSSASVERLFSLVGSIFKADRANLSDANLEIQALMCANNKL